MEVKLKTEDPGNSTNLVERILSGDKDAETELVERYTRGVSVILTRTTGERWMIEDLVQDTFQLVLEKLRRGELRCPEKLSGFICNIARNLAIDCFRRAARHERAERELPLDSPTSADPLQQLLTTEKVSIVHRMLNELHTARDREVLYRFYIAEQDKQQICAELSLTSLHFNRVLFRARERYRELYEKAMQKQPPALR
jgi:RNA polymerase sigma-70 factor (ECF subfamily)